MQAIADPPAYQRARAAVRYDDVARTLVHAFKYGDRLDLAPLLGALDGARRRRNCSTAPTRSCRCRCTGGGCGRGASTSRRAGRGDLARAAASRSRTRALQRVKATAQQVGLSRAERATQRAGRVPRAAGGKAEVAGRRLILIDDVLTSGATVGCLRAGAAAGRRRAGRRAGVRPGCRRGASAHIVARIART